jgi:hydrogenase maturation protease
MAVRLLGLGNEILGDDAFGILVARQVREALPGIEVVTSSESGFQLLDQITGAERLVVIDTIQTGRAEPGTIYLLREQDLPAGSGDTPHCTGLADALLLARSLGLRAPSEVTVIAVEPADCFTVGGPMHPAVAAAVRRAVELVGAEYVGRAAPTA